MSQPPKLCSDIFELIIGHLRDDSDSLLTCSVVCRDWHTDTRKHLFKRLHIELAEPRNARSRRANLGRDVCTLNNLVSFLQNTPSVQGLIQELLITDHFAYVEADSDGSSWSSGRLRPSTVEELWMALDLLPALHTLILSGMSIPDNNLMSAKDTATHHSLHKLVISGVNSPVTWLLPIMAHFASIDELHLLHGPRCSQGPHSLTEGEISLPKHLRINSLVVRGSPVVYMSALSFLPTLSQSLTSLDITPDPSHPLENITEIGQLLLQRGKHMTHFGLDISEHALPTNGWDGLHLASCTVLKTFLLHIHGNDALSESRSINYYKLSNRTIDTQWSSALTLISHLSRSVRRITISLALPYIHTMDRPYLLGPIPKALALAYDWNPLDSVLCDFKQLELVTFNRFHSDSVYAEWDGGWSYDTLEPAWMQFLQGKLPALKASGKLDFLEGRDGNELQDEWFDN